MKALLAAGLLLACTPAQSQKDDEPPPPQPSAGTVQVPPVEPPRIAIKSRIEEKDPKLFAMRISELLGAEVVLPRKLEAKPFVEAGSWTANEILDGLAKRIECVWRLELDLRKPTGEKHPPKSNLGPLDRIHLSARITAPKAARLIGKQVGAVARVAEDDRELLNLDYRDVPADVALSDLAEGTGRELWTRVVFVPTAEDADEAVLTQSEEFLGQLMEQTEQKSELESSLRELTNLELDDPDFPWEAAPYLVSLPNMTTEEVVGLLGQLQAETEMSRLFRELDIESNSSPVDGPDEPAGEDP